MKIVFLLLFLPGISCLAQPDLSFSEKEEKEAVQKVLTVLKGIDLKPFQRLSLNVSSFRLRILVDTFGNSVLDSVYGLKDTVIIRKLREGVGQHLKMTPAVFEGKKLPYIFSFVTAHGASNNSLKRHKDGQNETGEQHQKWYDKITCSLGFGANLPVGSASKYSSMALGIESSIFLRFAKKWGAGIAVGQANYPKKQDLPLSTTYPQKSPHNFLYCGIYGQRIIKQYERSEWVASLDFAYAMRMVSESTKREDPNLFLQGMSAGFGLRYRTLIGKPGTGFANFMRPFGLQAFLTVRPFFLNYAEANGTAITLGVGYTVGGN